MQLHSIVNEKNIILKTDSYKVSHWKQYPPGTEYVYSYLESRRHARYAFSVFFGLQAILKQHFTGPVVTQSQIYFADQLLREHLGPDVLNLEGWQYIVDEHDGHLPVQIKAVPEGTKVPVSNVLMTIENTDPRCYWLTNYLETLLVQVWYPITVATISNQVRRTIADFLRRTGDETGLGFKLHDFGFRGVSSFESAGLGGMAHLVNFDGTDTLPGIVAAQLYYKAQMPGFSIPASEHSTITSWGEDHEVDAMRNMLEQYPSGLVACVSDSFDIDRACSDYWGDALKDKVLERDGVLVVRPDSGDVTTMVLNVLERLGEKFGTYQNEKGYKVLNDKVRVIQGDGCTERVIGDVLYKMQGQGWSADNIAFGMGGGLLQKLDRDTQRFAFKCSSITVNGEQRDVYKAPKSDLTKASKRGRLALVKDPVQGYQTVPQAEAGDRDELVTVFENGRLMKEWTFDEVRERAR